MAGQHFGVGLQLLLFALQAAHALGNGCFHALAEGLPVFAQGSQVLVGGARELGHIGRTAQGLKASPGRLVLLVFAQAETTEAPKRFAKLEIIGARQVVLSQYTGEVLGKFRIHRARRYGGTANWCTTGSRRSRGSRGRLTRQAFFLDEKAENFMAEVVRIGHGGRG